MDASSVVLGHPRVLRLVSCGRERCAKCCTVVSLDLSRRQSLSLFLFELLCSNSFALLGTFGLRKFGRHIHRCMNRMGYCLVTIVCLLGLFLFFLDGWMPDLIVFFCCCCCLTLESEIVMVLEDRVCFCMALNKQIVRFVRGSFWNCSSVAYSESQVLQNLDFIGRT